MLPQLKSARVYVSMNGNNNGPAGKKNCTNKGFWALVGWFLEWSGFKTTKPSKIAVLTDCKSNKPP